MKKLLICILMISLRFTIAEGQDLSFLGKDYTIIHNAQNLIGGIETAIEKTDTEGNVSLTYKCTDDLEVGKSMYTYFFDSNRKCTSIAVIYKSDFKPWREALNKRYQYAGDNVWFAGKIGLQITADIIEEVKIFTLWYMTLKYSFK